MTESATRYRLTATQASEREEQTALMQWAQSQERHYPPLAKLIAFPNGMAASSIVEARRMKAQGMKPGVPDLILPFPCGGKAGLWIEMKRRDGGRLSSDQRIWLDYLNEVGYHAAVAKGWEDASKIIIDYLENRLCAD